ncbi:MAG: integration host factor subunit alpha [Proteobacteria bacterium]|nr:integration host factor subunit alpha [Pseudomonadota bacterium]
MTKSDIIETVYENVENISKKQAGDLVETVFDLMKHTLLNGESLKISKFGNFIVREKNERIGRNPQSGETITISARRVVNFKASQVLREEINKVYSYPIISV